MSKIKSIIKSFIVLCICINSVKLEGEKCTVCSSNDIISCATAPEQVTFKLDPVDGFCSVYIDKEGNTQRINKKIKETCEASGPEACETCQAKPTEPCNNQIFPKDRLQCHQCTNCASLNVDLKPTICNIYDKDNKCFIDTKNSNRGCTTDESYTKNCNSENKCEECPNSGCNNKDTTTKITCFSCSSDKQNDCLCPKDGNKLETCTMEDTKKKCYLYQDNNVIKRGCGDKIPEGIPETALCEGDACNKCFESIKECYECDSEKDADCSSSDKLSNYVKSCQGLITSCFHCQNADRKRTTRGCGKSTDNNLVCKSCDKEKCNKDSKVVSCYVCDSNKNSKCATAPDTKESCPEDNDTCFVQINNDGVTIRGCKSSMVGECKDTDENCKVCDSNDCNDQVLQTNQFRCYQCQNSEDCNSKQEDPEKNSQICSNIVNNDKCYTYTSNSKDISRGCVSDGNVPDDCKKETGKCITCSTSNCNSNPLKVQSSRKCIVCKDNEETCKWSHDKSSAIQCKAELYFWETDACYTLKDKDGKVSRGCKSDISECSGDCKECNDNGCNNLSDNQFSCLRCRSDSDTTGTCAKTGEKITPKSCDTVPTAEKLGCYTYNRDNVIIRGCLSDLSNIEYANCKNDDFRACEICKEQDCNKLEAPNSSSMVKASGITMIMFVYIFVIKLLN